MKEGETLEVTERGVVVAVLSPAAAPGLERLRREGLVTPAVGRIADLPPPVAPPTGVTAAQVLQEMRDEDER